MKHNTKHHWGPKGNEQPRILLYLEYLLTELVATFVQQLLLTVQKVNQWMVGIHHGDTRRKKKSIMQILTCLLFLGKIVILGKESRTVTL